MTDRLSTLLHDEAAALDVPPVPHDIVAAGHREVRYRRTRTALVGAVAVLLVAVGASAAVDEGDPWETTRRRCGSSTA